MWPRRISIHSLHSLNSIRLNFNFKGYTSLFNFTNKFPATINKSEGSIWKWLWLVWISEKIASHIYNYMLLAHGLALLGFGRSAMIEVPGTVPDDLMDTVIKFGLYIGAVFQLICIAAVIVLPEKYDSSALKDGDVSEEDLSEGSPQATPRRPHAHHRPRKQDKKKRR